MCFHDCNGKANKKITPKEDSVMHSNNKSGSIITNIKVKIDFTLPELEATKSVTWNFHVYDSNKVRYDMIFGRDILKYLVLNLK